MPAAPSIFRRKEILFPILVAALGYFVDVYDLILFSIVRVPSLKSLGYDGEALLREGVFLINMQMAGMLIGGILWGIYGDKKGRINVLFGSILMYSIANIANGTVHSVAAYAAWRLIAGIGLAGELGAGITLVSEILPKDKRGLGTSVVAAVGICGALLAGFVANVFDWRVAFYIGGFLGFGLLLLRVGTLESGIFKQVKTQPVKRGSFFALFSNRKRLLRYLSCIFVGIPVWFVIGVLITFSPEFAREKGIILPVDAGWAIMVGYSGLALGDLASGLLSQYLQSRKKVILIYVISMAVLTGLFTEMPITTPFGIYALCTVLGFSVGYWAVFVTVAAEQFGTNIRATVATTAPNFVRGSLMFLTSLFMFLKGNLGVLRSAQVVGLLAVVVALVSLYNLNESFHHDLDYLEEF